MVPISDRFCLVGEIESGVGSLSMQPEICGICTFRFA
jgi:hypothetical protein